MKKKTLLICYKMPEMFVLFNKKLTYVYFFKLKNIFYRKDRFMKKYAKTLQNTLL